MKDIPLPRGFVSWLLIWSIFFLGGALGLKRYREIETHLVQQHAIESKFLPDPALTPGVVCPTVTVEDLRSPAFIRDSRTQGTKDGKKITGAEKVATYAKYGITTHATGQYEIDHLISIELGGSNDPRNLWPQSYSGLWNAHHKDRLENELHRRVLDGRMSLSAAQHQIATDWIACYCATFPQDVVGGVPEAVGKQANNEADGGDGK